jgi:type IV secretion system protein VirB2
MELRHTGGLSRLTSRSQVDTVKNEMEGVDMRCSGSIGRTSLLHALLFAAVLAVPDLALAQASPFLTGANSLQTNILAWATPIAVILVMVLGIMAMANRISWGWPITAIVGIAVVFGAPQMVTWIRGMFGV